MSVTVRDTRTLSPEAQEELRRRGVAALLGGASKTQVAVMLGVRLQTVWRWEKRYAAGGEAGLASGVRGQRPGVQKALSPEQEAALEQALKAAPDSHGLNYHLWTVEAVRELIIAWYDITLSPQTVGVYLRSWGLSPQKPIRRAIEQDPAKVAAWLRREYPKIVAAAKKDKAEIFWADQMGLRSDHHAGRTWAPRGKTPVVYGTGKRFRLNVMAAISNRGSLRFTVFAHGFRGPVFIDFLDRLARQAGRKVHVIVDGHPVHRAKLVKAWLANNADRVMLHYLPGYSPELNPTELLNGDVKTNALGRRRPVTVEQMDTEVRSYLHKRQKQPGIVARYFHHPKVAYAA